LQNYPTVLTCLNNDRTIGEGFPSGPNSITAQVKKAGKKVYTVTAGGIYPSINLDGRGEGTTPGGFRNGRQENLLIWDRWADIYLYPNDWYSRI
jgi:hypothetical protein